MVRRWRIIGYFPILYNPRTEVGRGRNAYAVSLYPRPTGLWVCPSCALIRSLLPPTRRVGEGRTSNGTSLAADISDLLPTSAMIIPGLACFCSSFTQNRACTPRHPRSVRRRTELYCLRLGPPVETVGDTPGGVKTLRRPEGSAKPFRKVSRRPRRYQDWILTCLQGE